MLAAGDASELLFLAITGLSNLANRMRTACGRASARRLVSRDAAGALPDRRLRALGQAGCRARIAWPAVEEIAGRGQEFLVGKWSPNLHRLQYARLDFDGLYAVQFQAEPGVAEFRYIPSAQFHSSRWPGLRAA